MLNYKRSIGIPKPGDINYEEFKNQQDYYKSMSYNMHKKATEAKVVDIVQSTIEAVKDQHKALYKGSNHKSHLDTIKDSQLFDVYEVKPNEVDKTSNKKVTNKEIVTTMVTSFFESDITDTQLNALKGLVDGLNYTEKDQFLRELFNSCMDKFKVNNRLPIINFNRLMVKIVSSY